MITEFFQGCFGELSDLLCLPDTPSAACSWRAGFFSKLCAVSVCLGGWMAGRGTTELILLGKKVQFSKFILKKEHFLPEHRIITKQNVAMDFRRKY